MGALFPDLVRPPAPKKPRRVIAHPMDRGEAGYAPPPKDKAAGRIYFATFACKRCGWDSGWIWCTNLEERGGVPCPTCNLKEPSP